MASEPSEWARGYMRILEDEDSCAECGDFEGDGEACECEDTCGRFLRRCAIADVAKAEGDKAGYERGVREGEARAKLNALCAIRADAVREREGIRNCGNRITEAMAGGAWDSLIQTLDCMIHRARGEPQADGKGGG